MQPSLSRAVSALDHGRGGEAANILSQILRSSSLTREDELAIRCTLAEAWLLQDDISQASAALGRPPESLREVIPPARLSALWLLHGRVAFVRGDQSRAIALYGRALKQAEAAHDSRAIGLAHYELGKCYTQVGDATPIVAEHLNKAASALHAAGDRRHLAMVHSLSGIMMAQSGRTDEAMTALRQAERLAVAAQAEDVLATVCGNQASVAMIQHRHDQALALADRSVSLHEQIGSGHGLALALATLGQICVRLGDLERAERVLHRALEVRTPIQFHELTGAVFDTLAQIHLMRGANDQAAESLRRASEAYGRYGAETSRWYEWSIRVLAARLALRRGSPDEAIRLADQIVQSPEAPPSDTLQADMIACEALLAASRSGDAEQRLEHVGRRLNPQALPGAWGEYLRVRASLLAANNRSTEAYHDLAQSTSVFELLADRYQAGLSHLALGRLVARSGARSAAERHLHQATSIFESLGAARDLSEAQQAGALLNPIGTGEYVSWPADADDAIVRRLVDAAALPDLLEREVAEALLEASAGDAAVIFAQPSGDVRVIAHAGCDKDTAIAVARSASHGAAYGTGTFFSEPMGREPDGPRAAAVASPRPLGHPTLRRLRMIAAVARQGFDLCSARQKPSQPVNLPTERPLEPLLPGFLCASAAMNRVIDQIQRLQGNDLTVLITGESGTGKELVARAIHVGSPRSAAMFLPYNCTNTTRDLADSQLFGHRRGSFTGAVTDQLGLVRSAAGGTLFLDEIGDLPLDVQPKLLRFLEQGEIMPVGETRPQRVDVRVIAATNADLEQRVAEGKVREDLYYRLSVIRIHVPPLRERREEIPHLSTYLLREASERLGKPDVLLSSDALDLLVQYWWPGNVRQLRNEIQRAVAMSVPGATIGADHLSADVTAVGSPLASLPSRMAGRGSTSLASAVEQVERDLISATMTSSGGNISETARMLGLTRRGLYLKLRRLGLENPGPMDTK